MKALIQKLFGGEAEKVFRGMAKLAMGSGLGKLIALLAIPILTRIYLPEHFGLMAIFAALVAMLSPILTLRYVLATPLPKRDATAMNLMAVAGFSLLFTTVIVTVLFWLLAEYLLNLLSMSALLPWWWLVVIASFSLACFEALSLWATRKRNYAAMAKSQVSQQLIGAMTKVLLGLMALKPGGLLIGQMLTQSSGSLTLWRFFKKSYCDNRRHVTVKRMKLVATYYFSYPSYRLASQILLILAVQAPLLLSAWLFDASTTGQLSLAIMALSMPATLIGDNMAKAFYAEISVIGRNHPEKIRRMSFAVIKRLGVLSAVPALVLLFLGEWIFNFVFGSEWTLAGQFASALAVYLVFQFLSKPVSYLMFVFDGQKQLLYLNIQRVVLTFGCFWVGQQLGMSALNVITLYAVVLAVHYLFSIIVAINMIKKEP